MTEVPKIVHSRLRAVGQAVGLAHPETELLAAFIEQALSPAERETVLAHLALCADCRKIAVLALPEATVVATAVETAPEAETVLASGAREFRQKASGHGSRNWLGWGNLRWAALAAGIAVAVLVMRPGIRHVEKANPIAVAKQPSPQIEPGTVAPQVAGEFPAQRKASANITPATPSEDKPANSLLRAKTETPAAKPMPARKQAMTADNQVAQLAKPERHAYAVSSADRASGTSTNEDLTNEGSAAVPTEDAASSSDLGLPVSTGSLMARAQAPAVERAKPALDESTAFWTISAGMLKRSLDGGQNWHAVLPGKHNWQCYAARNQDVWAGGAKGALQHSADGGTTWSRVVVSGDGESLHSDVIQIDLQDPSGIVLETADHQTWSSPDSGNSWQKK